MSLLFTDFSLLPTRLFRKHSIYPLFVVFHLYGYISSQFLKSLFSDVLSLLFKCILTDYLLNFSTSFFYLGYILSLLTSILFLLKISSLSLHLYYYYNDIFHKFIIVIKKLAYCHNIITINLLFLLIVMIPYSYYFLLVDSIEVATTVSIVPTTFITVTISITFSSYLLYVYMYE